ncbi:arylsulfatase B-like [Anneissia japonica]|uniref:arylsulfatase B-like n=1 Tax=Anneissia japonica TaxID=1529436 RepID=UPI001425621A|nr:arylsulfatase B-like [Anneissia japonica]
MSLIRHCITFFHCLILCHCLKRPHIILFIADDYGYSDIGYHGSHIKTPHLDRLALSGVRLNNYYVQPICSPTRAQLMTGKYSIHLGLQHSYIKPAQPNCLPFRETTLGEKLQRIGYRTNLVGKWHLGFHKKHCWPTSRGFDHFFGFLTGAEDFYTHESDYLFPGKRKLWKGFDLREDDDNIAWNYQGFYSTHLFTKKAQRIIKKHDPAKPLFLVVSFQAVHGPLQVPKEYLKPYKYIKNEKRKIYAGMVSCMDEAVGNVTKTLKHTGLLENSVIVFTTDNGGRPHLGGYNWPLRGGKSSLWEGGLRGLGFIHSPLLPPRVRGTVNDNLMHVSDWFPTLVEGAAHGSVGKLELDGFNMWPVLSGATKTSPRKEILHNIDPLSRQPRSQRGLQSRQRKRWQKYFDTNIRAAIRFGKWKLITGQPGDGSWYIPPELYKNNKPIRSKDDKIKRLWLFNIAVDPTETIDLSRKRPDIVSMLLKRLSYYHKHSIPPTFPKNDVKANPKLYNQTWTDWSSRKAKT